MPKLRLTDQQQREKALKLAIARGMVELGLDSDQAVIDYTGIKHTTYYRKIKEPYQGFGFAEAAELARKLRFTDRELCAIFGVPYAPDRRDLVCA